VLKKRLAATLIIREGIVVQSINFRKYLPVGKPAIAVEFLNEWGIDEIVILDITASKDLTRKKYDFIETVARSCFVPLTVGGGINSIEDIRNLLSLGADKISINSACFSNPNFISTAANIFGSQCIMVSIDVKEKEPSVYRVYNASNDSVLDLNPVSWAKTVESLGAGEIFLNSVDRDGSKKGFDIELINLVAGSVQIPVVACGGAANFNHVLEAFSKTSASGISAANYFHFSEHSVITTKAALLKHGVDIRLNTHANYENNSFDLDFRLKKQPEAVLENLLFEKVEKEVI
jgi:cyclase